MSTSSSGYHRRRMWQVLGGEIPTIIVWGCENGGGGQRQDPGKKRMPPTVATATSHLHLTCTEHCCFVSVSYIHRTKIFPVCRQWEPGKVTTSGLVGSSSSVIAAPSQAISHGCRQQREVVTGSCCQQDLADWGGELLQEMTRHNNPLCSGTTTTTTTMDHNNQLQLEDRLEGGGSSPQRSINAKGTDPVMVSSSPRIIPHHTQSKSAEENRLNYLPPSCHHKQSRSDDILNRSGGPPPVPANSPAQSDHSGWNIRNRNNSNGVSGGGGVSIDKTNSKSMESLLPANHHAATAAMMMTNPLRDIDNTTLHKCASHDNMQMARVNDNGSSNRLSLESHHDVSLSMSTISTSTSTTSGLSIMESLVREFGMQQAPSLSLSMGADDDRGPPPSYPGAVKSPSCEGAMSLSGESAGPMSSSGSLLSNSRSYESMHDTAR